MEEKSGLLKDLPKEKIIDMYVEIACDNSILLKTKAELLKRNKQLASVLARLQIENTELMKENVKLIMLCKKNGLL